MASTDIAFTKSSHDQKEKLEDLGKLVKHAKKDRKASKTAHITGFVPMSFDDLKDYMLCILKSGISDRPISLELGSGIGSWTMLAASFGFPAYGIEANPNLLEVANKTRDKARNAGLIEPSVPCEFALGNFFTDRYLFERREVLMTMCHFHEAWKKLGDPYKELGIDIKDAGLIYTWPWPDEIEFAGDFLAREAANSTIIILPYYHSQHSLKLTQLPHTDSSGLYPSTRIGRKKQSKAKEPAEFRHRYPKKSDIFQVGDIISIDHKVDTDDFSIPKGSEARIYSIGTYYYGIEVTKFACKNPPRQHYTEINPGHIGGIIKKFDAEEYAKELGLAPQKNQAD